MGGERASKTRQRLAGKVCCMCYRLLDAPPWPGERKCAKCEAKAPSIAVVMNFQQRDGWIIHFIATDCRTVLSRFYNVGSLENLRCLIQRTPQHEAALEEFDRNVKQWGRGSLSLRLTPEQYKKLRR